MSWKSWAMLTVIGWSLSGCMSGSIPALPERDRPIIILDTDFGGDADDLGAIAMLHDYADQGAIEFKAIISWSHEAYAVPALAAINQYYQRPDLPVGVREVAPWRTEWNHTKAIADQFPYDPSIVDQASPAVRLYRTVLAGAENNSVTIVTVGPLANIQNLLQSPADTIAPLSGAELVDAKVDKFVMMGGQFPDGITAHGAEWNFDGNMPGVTKYVLETLERPIIFSGYEVGEALRVGQELNAHPDQTPIYVGYKYFSEHAPWMKPDYEGAILDNASFDQTAVMYAAIGGLGEFWTLSVPGVLRADEQGIATWRDDPAGNHRFLILTEDRDHTEAKILEGMTHLPGE